MAHTIHFGHSFSTRAPFVIVDRKRRYGEKRPITASTLQRLENLTYNREMETRAILTSHDTALFIGRR